MKIPFGGYDKDMKCKDCIHTPREPVCYNVYGDEGVPVIVTEEWCCGAFEDKKP